MKKTSKVLLISLSVVLFSCRKEMGKPSWETQLLVPIVKASLDINNLLPDSILQANPDSSLKIVYNNDIYSLTMDTLFKIEDTTLFQGYALPIQQTLSSGINFINNATNTTYQLPGVELRKVIIKSGKVEYTIKNKVHHIMDFTYSIPGATFNGNPFTINISVPAAVGSVPGIFSQIYDLAGYSMDLTGSLHNQVNTIYTSLQAKISNDQPSNVVVNPQDSLVITNTFSDIVPYYALGYFGANTFNLGPSESDFSIFKRIVGGHLSLEDVNINFKIENPIGIDARMNVGNLYSRNSRTGTIVNLSSGTLINRPININRAAESVSGMGNVFPTYANFPLNAGNSNIKPFIENLPDKLGYIISIFTNPLGNVSGSNDFIYSDKLLKVGLNMEIPLSLVASNLTLVDTLGLNIVSTSGTQNIHSGTITLFADNGFPFDAKLQAYLLNENNMIADSIFGYTGTIDEAPVNTNLRAIGKKLTKIAIPINEAKMSLLYSTKKIALKVKFNTASQPDYIKIYSDYTLDINIVGDINYTVNLK